MSNMGDHVWLITSRQTEPELEQLIKVCLANEVRVNIHLINVWVEDAVDKADTGTFVRICVR